MKDDSEVDFSKFTTAQFDTNKARLSNNLREAVRTNPMDQAKSLQLSRESGVPVEAVKGDPAEVQSSIDFSKFDVAKIQKESPRTSQFLSDDFNNSAIAREDVASGNLQNIEKSYDNLTKRDEPSDEINTLGNLARVVPKRAANLLGDLYSFASQAGDELGDALDLGALVFDDGIIPRYVGNDEWNQFREDGGTDLVKTTGDILKGTTFGYEEQATWGKTKEVFANGSAGEIAAQTIAFGVEQGAASLADMVATVYALPTYIVARSYDIGDKRALNDNRSESDLQDTLNAAPFAVGVAVLERVLPNSVFKKLSEKQLNVAGQQILTRATTNVKEITKATGGGLLLEAGTEAVQEGVLEYLGETYGTEKKLDFKEALDRAAAGAVGGGVAGGIISGATETVTTITRKTEKILDDEVKSEERQLNDLNDLDTLSEQVKQSKTKELDGETFKQFINKLDENSDKKVFIDNEQLAVYLQDIKQTEIDADPALSAIATRLGEAEAGVDVAVPISEFAEVIAGTDHYTNLRDHITVTEGTSTVFRQEETRKATQDYVDNVLAEAEKNTSQYVESQAIYDNVKDQLIDTGTLNPAHAKFVAQVVPAWAAQRAERTGESITSVYESAGLTIEGPQTGGAARVASEEALLQGNRDVDTLFFPRTPTSDELTNLSSVKSVKLDTTLNTESDSLRAKNPQEGTPLIEGFGDKPVVVRRSDGSHLIYDGHNRVADAIARGVTELDMHVIDAQKFDPVGDKKPTTVDPRSDDDLLSELFGDNESLSEFLGDDSVTLNDTPVATNSETTNENGQRRNDVNQRNTVEPSTFQEAISRTEEQANAEFDRAKSGEEVTFVHRSPVDFNSFDDKLVGTNTSTPSASLGHYLSAADVGNAAKYGNTLSAHTFTLKNPLVVDAETFEITFANASPAKVKRMRDTFIAQGHDGVLVNGVNYAIVFNSESLTKQRDDSVDQLLNQTNQDNEARGYYDPQNSLIRLNESADLSTFLHEFSHFMYQTEVDSNSDIAADSGKWFKRNAADVAKEANSYANTNGELFNQPSSNLDMSKKARLARAEEQGFNTKQKVYHGTSVDFDAFDPDRALGTQYWSTTSKENVENGSVGAQGAGVIKEMYTNIKNPAGRREYDQLGIDEIIARGYDGVALERDSETLYIAFDPSQYRSVDAAFDPKDKGSSFLLAQSDQRSEKTNGDITAEDVIAYIDNKTTGDAIKDSHIRRATHEQFARGFESYVMEGKAPSIELRNAFRKFTRWLTDIYRNVQALDVNLDDDMRAVFDRLLASEDQIEAAQTRARDVPLFTDATLAGMTEEQFLKYKEDIRKNKDVQSETLRDQVIAELTRQATAEWKAERKDLIDENVDALKKENVYIATDQLRNGDVKLDHATVKEMFGEQRVDKRGIRSTRIPSKLSGMTIKGAKGVHPDQAAGVFGFNSGAELLHDLINEPKLIDAATTQAEATMIERHGDILTDGTIEKKADEAVQNAQKGELLLKELKALNKGSGRPNFTSSEIRDTAKTHIAALSYRDIQPAKYRRAEIREAQLAAKHLAEGNVDAAAQAKIQQTVNHYLALEATEARNETAKIVDNMARYNKKKVREEIQKAENGYWEQITKILNRFEFRKSATLNSVNQLNEDINTWAAQRMAEDGDGLVLTTAVLNESYVNHWKNVPFGELEGIRDSVKNIEHVARYANKIKLGDEKIDFKKFVQQWTDHIGQQDSKFDTKASRSRVKDAAQETLKEGAQRWLSQLTKVPFLASWLDGGERVGMSHDVLMDGVNTALDEKLKMMDEVTKPIMDILDNRSKADLKRHARKIFIPEINDTLEGHQVLAVALNVGNQGNLRKILLGEGWATDDSQVSIDNPKLQAVLKHMTKSDWEFVQTTWDQMNTLYPQLAEVHRKTTGLTPPKVESTPVVTPYGTFQGGYYPVKYAPKRSVKAAKNAEKLEAETDSLFNNTASIQASVNTGATQERSGFYDKVRLDISIIPEHFNETIHFITHHGAVRQLNKLIQNPEVENAISAVVGESEFNQLKPWLNDVAKDGREAPVKSYIDSMFQRLRFGVTLGVMGFNSSTGIMQIFGLATTAGELGLAPTIKGIVTTVGRANYFKAIRNVLGSTDDMQTGWDFAAERSKVMNHRMETMDREIRNAMQRLKGQRGVLPWVQEASMKHIALMQTYMVDLPTWHAAYDKGLQDWGDDVRAAKYADWAVENLQGSGATKDMATLMRSQTKLQSTYTMFMTFFSSLGNITRDTSRGAQSGLYSPTNVAAKAMFLVALPVFFESLLRGELDEPEGEDDRLSKLAMKAALYPVTSLPVIRDIASGLGSEYGYNTSPVSAILERGIAGAKQLKDGVLTDKEVTASAVKNTSKVVAASLGIPATGQIWKSGEHIFDVIEEGEDFTIRELLLGPDRK